MNYRPRKSRYRRVGRAGAHRRSAAALVALAAAISVSVVLPPVAVAQTEPVADPVERIIAARLQANEYAQRVFELESELDELELQADKLAGEVAELENIVNGLRDSAANVAVDAFIGTSDPGIPVLTEGRDPLDKITERVFAEVVNGGLVVDIDTYEHSVAELDDARTELSEARAAVEQSQSEFEESLESALQQVEVLRGLETEFLDDEATADAVRAAWAAENRVDDARRRDEQLAQEQALVPIVAPGADGDVEPSLDGWVGGLGDAGLDINGDPRGGRTAGGAVVAGRTGQGGTGSDGRRPPPAVFLCPVGGPSSYADTWGAPRSGGRRHQGVDMLATSGTPLVAVVAGTVTHRSNRLGGVTATLHGGDGNRYYYAHLSSYEGSPRAVAQGEVIGFVGDTGNATGIPHLHFEIHPGGGAAINPYPAVRAAGC